MRRVSLVEDTQTPTLQIAHPLGSTPSLSIDHTHTLTYLLIVFDVLYLIVFDVLYPSGLLFIIEVSNAEKP